MSRTSSAVRLLAHLPEFRTKVNCPPADMEHWHVPYNYPRADHAQAWLLKCLEGVIARDADKESNWMFRQRCVFARMLK